ncbi:thymidine phosphorylase [bacterium]|jgi:thymidine phosphorylase|nr:thymidine phosphorylase [bacterium]
MKYSFVEIDIDSGPKDHVILNKAQAAILGVGAADRVQITNLTNKQSLNNVIVDYSQNTKKHTVGLFKPTRKRLGLKKGDKITIHQMGKPISTLYIKNKLDGKKLSKKQIAEIIKDVVYGNLSPVELAYFVAGAYIHGFNFEETANLTQAIAETGNTIKFKKGQIVVDKHCIGGVPGNRTTMIMVPILTALGLYMPKTSTRSITSPAGTVDTMEVLANVMVDYDQIPGILKKTKGFIIWGGTSDLADADDNLIEVRHSMNIDPTGMVLASVLAKKKAAGSTHVLIDLPYGKHAKITKSEASKWKKDFEKIGKLIGLEMKVITTVGNQPIGNGIGAYLEAQDVLKVLNCASDAPADLREKSLQMAGILLELSGKTSKNKGYQLAKETLDSKKALKQFQKIMKTQGPAPAKVKAAAYTHELKASKAGTIKEIHIKNISKAALILGAPKDKSAGVYMQARLGDKVQKNQSLLTLHYNNKQNLESLLKQKLLSEIFSIK